MPRPDQTEKATPKRQGEARDRGQVARSADLSGAALFLIIVIMLHFWLLPTVDAAGAQLRSTIESMPQAHAYTIFDVPEMILRQVWSYVALLGFMFAAIIGVGLAANWLQFGFLFSAHKLKPSFASLNPVAGIKRLFFSMQTFINLGKQLLKMAAVGMIMYSCLHDRLGELYNMSRLAPRDLLAFMNDVLFGVGIRFGMLLFVLGLADYAWEKYHMAQSMKMSKQEVKDEARQAEGNPEAKSAVKGRQRSMARKRMMAAVPTATVVITNPTHFAVALLWDDQKMQAPVLVAKGADLIAKRIRDIARENDVPVMENPPLARNIYATVDLDSPVPPSLYAAVAQVIAFVFRLKQKTSA